MALASILTSILGNNSAAKRAALDRKFQEESQKKLFEHQDKLSALEKQHAFDTLFTKAALDEDTFSGNLGKETSALSERDINARENALAYSNREAIAAGNKASMLYLGDKYGITPKDMEEASILHSAGMNRYLAEAEAASQKAKTEGLGSEIKREGLGQTRSNDLSRLFSESQEGAFRADRSRKFAEENPKALEAGMMGRELAPASALARGNTMSVGPGEYLKRFSSGSPVIDSFFSPAEGRGATQNEVTTVQNFGGMQIPNTSRVTTPGHIEQLPPPTPKAALNGQNAPSPVMPQQQGRISLLSKPPTDMSQFQFSTPQFRNGQLQSSATMPEDPIAEQERKKKEAAEAIMNLQRLFSQPQYTPNSINR